MVPRASLLPDLQKTGKPLEFAPQAPKLLRVLGLATATAMDVANTIGSGIFVKPGIIAQQLGDFPRIMAAWVLGGVLCVLGGLCPAELAAMPAFYRRHVRFSARSLWSVGRLLIRLPSKNCA